MEIREAISDEDKLAVYRLRYEVYVEELGGHEPHADHEKRILTDPHDNSSRILGAWDDTGHLIATLRNNSGSQFLYLHSLLSTRDRDLYRMDLFEDASSREISLSSMFVARKDHLDTRVVAKLLKESYLYLVERGVKYDFIHYEKSLDNLFKKMGYRPYLSELFGNQDRFNFHPLVLCLYDYEYLNSIKSSLAPLCHKQKHLVLATCEYLNDGLAAAV